MRHDRAARLPCRSASPASTEPLPLRTVSPAVSSIPPSPRSEREETYEGARMRGSFRLVAPGIVRTQVEGHVDAAAVRWYTARIDRLLLEGKRIQTFHDWIGIDGFEPDVRAPYRAWADRQKDLLDPPHFLVRSKIVAMALSVTSLVLGHGLVVVSDRVEFERALADAIRDRRT